MKKLLLPETDLDQQYVISSNATLFGVLSKFPSWFKKRLWNSFFKSILLFFFIMFIKKKKPSYPEISISDFSFEIPLTLLNFKFIS